MTHSDPIADLLMRIKNAYLARRGTVLVPYSKIKEQIARVLKESNYIGKIEIETIDKKKTIKIELLYKDGKPVLTNIVRESKPGLRKYIAKNKINTLFTGVGIVILTTSKGVMTAKRAKKVGVGGEVVCRVW